LVRELANLDEKFVKIKIFGVKSHTKFETTHLLSRHTRFRRRKAGGRNEGEPTISRISMPPAFIQDIRQRTDRGKYQCFVAVTSLENIDLSSTLNYENGNKE
jgi:hypothetical protein